VVAKLYVWDPSDGGGGAGDGINRTDPLNWDVDAGGDDGTIPDDAEDELRINSGADSIDLNAPFTVGKIGILAGHTGTTDGTGGLITVDDSGSQDGSVTYSAASTWTSGSLDIDGALSATGGTLSVAGNDITARSTVSMTSGMTTFTMTGDFTITTSITTFTIMKANLSNIVIPTGVTPTRSGDVQCGSVEIQGTGDIQDGTGRLKVNYDTKNDALDVSATGDISSGIDIDFGNNASVTQKAFTVTGDMDMRGPTGANLSTITLTGNAQVGNWQNRGGSTVDQTWDCATFDFTCTGTFQLGDEASRQSVFDCGTGTIDIQGGIIATAHSAGDADFDCATATIKVGGSCDLTNMDLLNTTTSTLELNGSSGSLTLTTDGETLPPLTINHTATIITLQDTVTCPGWTNTQGNIDQNSQAIIDTKSWTWSAGTLSNPGALSMTGSSGSLDFFPGGQTYGAITVNHTATQVLFNDVLTCASYTNTLGTTNFDSNAVNCAGSWTWTAGVANNVGNITMNPASGSHTFTAGGITYNLVVVISCNKGHICVLACRLYLHLHSICIYIDIFH